MILSCLRCCVSCVTPCRRISVSQFIWDILGTGEETVFIYVTKMSIRWDKLDRTILFGDIEAFTFQSKSCLLASC